MHIYSLKCFITKLDVGSNKLQQPDLAVIVTCSDFLNLRVKYNVKFSAYNALIKSTGCSKAVFFSAPSVSRLVTAFGSNIKVAVFEIFKGNEEFVGNGDIKWPGFEKVANGLRNPNDHVESEGTFPLFKDEKVAGTIQVQMCLVYYGERIQIPNGHLRSALSIPMNLRRKRHGKKKKEPEPDSSNTEGGARAPLFVASKEPSRSIMDPSMEMSGISAPPPIKSLLTPKYINQKLCGHIGCPGAEKFKEFGLGPLAPEGSCLGTVASSKGLYGMSQAYGTMNNYGAYGLFVNKLNKKRKTSCGSPDRPYTTFNEVVSKAKRCQCKHCKNDRCNRSKQSARNRTCGNPHCPKKAPTFGVPCCHRQSAGADTYSASGRQPSNGTNRQNGPCGGVICPANPGDCLGPSCNMDSCEEETNNQCGGRQCPFRSYGMPGECPTGTCPHVGCGKGGRRKSKSSEQPAMLDELNSFLDKTSAIAEKKKNCKDKTCPYYEADEGKDEVENCDDESCPANQGNNYYEDEPEEQFACCREQVCPLLKKFGQPAKETSIKNKKRLSLLINEDEQKLIFGKGDDADQNEILGRMDAMDQSHVYLMISRLLEQRQRSHSLNNYYNPDMTLSMQNFVSTMRFRSFDAGNNGDHIKPPKEKHKHKGPCSQDSCKSLKYKRCSDCGGISKSGATCDNTNVSFSTISYDSIITPGAGDQTISDNAELNTMPNTPTLKKSPSLKNKITKEETTVKIAKETTVKIAKEKRKNTRFVYNVGEAYPGVRLGHKVCVMNTKNVPAHMGWLWNIKEGEKRKRKKKWKPGYLRKEIEDAIIENRRRKGIPDPPELKMLVRKHKSKGPTQSESESDEEEVVPKPTLIIQKKEGNYLITMHPLKDPKKLEDREDPYMRCKPIQFVITKPPKKTPHAPDINGYEEIEGEDEGEDFENFYKTNNCYCDVDPPSSSSSDSELNIEFTTPAGIIIPEMFKRPPNVVNVNTQFKEADFQCSDCPIVVPKKFKKERGQRKKK